METSKIYGNRLMMQLLTLEQLAKGYYFAAGTENCTNFRITIRYLAEELQTAFHLLDEAGAIGTVSRGKVEDIRGLLGMIYTLSGKNDDTDIALSLLSSCQMLGRMTADGIAFIPRRYVRHVARAYTEHLN